ncbi:MAG: hypothetical protein FK730_07455 [Asgard group archaeon]|nr:hypothetical protein [Asgard group archaeon]
MKRIITIDVLRGAAIILMILFHTWLNVMDLDILDNLNLSEINPFLVALAIIFFFLGRSRTLFLFISAIIHQYKFMKSLNEGKNPERLLYSSIIKGGIVFLLGVFREGVLSPWGAINSLILTGEVSKTTFRLAYICETLQIIGLSIIFLSVLSYIFFKKQWLKDTVFTVSVLAILGLLFLFLAPTIHESVNNFLGYDLTRIGSYNHNFRNTSEYFTRFFWMSIAGVESPIFPNFFVTCVGGIFGYYLAKPNLDKKFVRYSALAGTLFILSGVIHLVFIDELHIDFWFRVFPTWFMLINMGVHIYLLTILLAIFEFRKKANLKKYAQLTISIRRWSIVGLTVYMIQFADLFIRMICSNQIGIDFTNRHQQGFGWSIFMMFVAFLFFDAIIRIWERFRFIGTFEWIMIQFTRLLVGRRQYNSMRLKVKESLYEVKPISFIQKEIIDKRNFMISSIL